MSTKLEINELERAYTEAAQQAIGANMLRLELLLVLPAVALAQARAYQQELERKAAAALSRWKTAVGCTPEFEAAYAAQQRNIGWLQEGISTAQAA